MKTMLEKIIARRDDDYKAQCELMRTPEFLARVEALQKVADLLSGDGFRVWEQLCWDSGNEHVSIILHARIKEGHDSAGVRRIMDLVPSWNPASLKIEGDIEIIPQTGYISYGWEPPKADHAVAAEAAGGAQ